MENILVELNESELNLVIQAVEKYEKEKLEFATEQKGDAYKITMGVAGTLGKALIKLYNVRRNLRLQSKHLN